MLMQPNGRLAVGACDDVLKTIYICNNLNNRYTKKVLCHELTHAVMFSYNVELTHEQEEMFADLISNYGEQILQLTNLLFKKFR